MVNRFVHFLEILFPPRAEQVVISNTTNAATLYQPGCVNGVWYAASYTHPAIKAASLENKFYQNKAATEILATVLEHFILEKGLEEGLFLPVPLSTTRYRERGYNQTAFILKRLSQTVIVNEKVIQRVRNTPPQMKLQRAQRLTNMKGAFAVNVQKIEKLGPTKTIVLVDDVVTTGTTLREAKATLTPHFPNTKIICLAIAH